MSSRSDRLLALAMPLLILAGMFLPQVSAVFQDQERETQVNSRILGGIEFSQQGEISAVFALNVLSKETTRIVLQEGTNLTKQGALAYCEEAFKLLEEKKLLPETEQGVVTAWAFLAVANTGDGASAVVWSCAWRNQNDAQCTLLIDDATGKMVGIHLFMNTHMTTVSEDAGELLFGRAKRWAEFCREYYEFQEAEVKAEYNDGISGLFQLELSKTEGDKRISLKLPLRFHDNEFFFNQ